ncbi:MAG: alanine racemase [Acidimicrobiales bacterium]
MAVEGVRRPAWAEISASAIGHNVRALKRVVGETALCAVVKANGYGHGAPLVAAAALDAGADSLAVAIVDEGIELRKSGITVPILLLAEIPAATIRDALRYDLTLTIGSPDGARDAVAAAHELRGRHRAHVKVDTGMHRMGVAPSGVDEVFDTLASSPTLETEGLFTHFSVADGASEDDRAFTRVQIDRFNDVITHLRDRGQLPRVIHAANSAGALGYPDARYSMVRVGLSLYGYVPDPWLAAALADVGEHLEVALTLRARVVAARRVKAGARPSYGRRRETTRDTTVVTVPFGYADGYPRRLFDGGAEVLINGRRYPLAGGVTMDQLIVDVGDDDVKVGDEVILLGRQGDEVITADELARGADTITWEILACLGARVPRVVVD